MATTHTKQSTKEMENLKSYPAPEELATPTDLRAQEVQRVVDAINPLVADAFALYLKTKNFHWHVASSHYRDYHLLFEEQAEAILASIDPLAERVRRIGGLTLRSISHVGQLQTIDDQNRDFVPPDEMIDELLRDNTHVARQMREAIEICEDNRDTPTANLLQELLDQTERRIWFLHAVSTGGKNQY
ncbi:MAG TPA: DNA starvation/stationary phase protection protein [Anaerolineales bacterium]|nr:DNA starvation/stationary phase protection protein [Anaerolineales bacterium]